jgi:hypothetical protein
MSSTEKPETDVETTSVGEVDTEEVVCEEETEATLEGRSAPADEQETLTPEQEAELDEMLRVRGRRRRRRDSARVAAASVARRRRPDLRWRSGRETA